MYSLLENQIDLILESLQEFTKTHKEKLQLINATYESILYQKCNKNVTQNLHNCYLQKGNYSIK